jgi:dihydroflavonol-4-reductase
MDASGTSGKTVLITGGSGFLGGWCVIEALRRGYTVRTTVRDLGRKSEVRALIAKEIDPGERLSFFAADLLGDAGWGEAAEGCDYVLHVASPFLLEQPDDANEFILPAREGTVRVLNAALDAEVKRIVLTSSIAAVMYGHDDYSKPLTEESWSDPDFEGMNPYGRSKTIAELAAWDLVRERGAEDRLATIQPGAIIGPVLSRDRSPSVQIVERLLAGPRGIPRLGFNLVDVRDVAGMHLDAMTEPEAAGERFIATGPFQWMAETAKILRDHPGDQFSSVPKRQVPDFVFKVVARFNPNLRLLARQLGRRIDFSWEKAETQLGWTPRPVEEAVVDTAESLIREGVVGGDA